MFRLFSQPINPYRAIIRIFAHRRNLPAREQICNISKIHHIQKPDAIWKALYAHKHHYHRLLLAFDIRIKRVRQDKTSFRSRDLLP